MKSVICLCTILGCAFSDTPLNWDDIRSSDITVDPLDTAPVTPGARIIGGTEVARNSIPYQAALIINDANFCSGSLISREWVLTAAHCTSGASLVRVILGAHNIRRTETTQLAVTTSSIINHPQYSRATLSNDIALIRLPYAVPISNTIQVITLAPATSGTFAGSIARLSGWGKTSDSAPGVAATLRAVNVNVIANSLCQQTYGIWIHPSTVCTFGGGLVGGCHGDSGGPLTVNGVQIGVVSFVSSWGCQSGTPTAYSRVSSFRDWIKVNTGV
ncbi:brachyurin-like [Anoplophora glabripennis]|uniref:brachyurin-like n=1 Tax=Anoplophora glabripennis TaxID=217634 RepID=UPI0008758C0D|nr:brachyurin-like [Anoplophora glabripennis]